MLNQNFLLTKPSLSGNTGETLKLTTSSADTSTNSLCQLIRSLLPEGYPNLSTVAAATGASIRTLQRRLKENNLNYSQLVEQVRFEQAIQLLQNPRSQLIDIAFDLGYSDAANFTRAFKRWAGISPREFRNLHLQE